MARVKLAFEKDARKLPIDAILGGVPDLVAGRGPSGADAAAGGLGGTGSAWICSSVSVRLGTSRCR